MAREAERKGPGSNSSDLGLVDSIKAIAAKNARAELDSEEALLLYLQSWWSRTYNRPLKDPVLLGYTLEELLYEFFDRVERAKAEEERVNQESDKIEEAKEKEVLDWAEQEEKKELEALKSAKNSAEAQLKAPAKDPLKDPDNIKWMEEHMKAAKNIFGDTFGENIDVNFDGE